MAEKRLLDTMLDLISGNFDGSPDAKLIAKSILALAQEVRALRPVEQPKNQKLMASIGDPDDG